MTGAVLTAATVRQQLAAACLEAGSQKAWAARHGISQGYLCDVLAKRREPGESILAALGLAPVVTYRAIK